jgi:TctA family transporter
MLTVPYRFLYPGILLICCIGVYSISNSALDVLIATVFGLVGYTLYRLGCEPAPLLLGFIFGPLIEENLRRALIISQGDPRVFIERPISLTFLVLTIALILVLCAPMIRSARERVFIE